MQFDAWALSGVAEPEQPEVGQPPARCWRGPLRAPAADGALRLTQLTAFGEAVPCL